MKFRVYEHRIPNHEVVELNLQTNIFFDHPPATSEYNSFLIWLSLLSFSQIEQTFIFLAGL
jgi:hypothetical protein